MVCVHLAEGLPQSWHGHFVPHNETAEAWLCPECDPHPWDIDLDGWALMCMHCIRELQAAPGTTVTIHESEPDDWFRTWG